MTIRPEAHCSPISRSPPWRSTFASAESWRSTRSSRGGARCSVPEGEPSGPAPRRAAQAQETGPDEGGGGRGFRNRVTDTEVEGAGECANGSEVARGAAVQGDPEGAGTRLHQAFGGAFV